MLVETRWITLNPLIRKTVLLRMVSRRTQRKIWETRGWSASLHSNDNKWRGYRQFSNQDCCLEGLQGHGQISHCSVWLKERLKVWVLCTWGNLCCKGQPVCTSADDADRSVFSKMSMVGWEFTELIPLFPSFRIFGLMSFLKQNPHNPLFKRACWKH